MPCFIGGVVRTCIPYPVLSPYTFGHISHSLMYSHLSIPVQNLKLYLKYSVPRCLELHVGVNKVESRSTHARVRSRRVLVLATTKARANLLLLVLSTRIQ